MTVKEIKEIYLDEEIIIINLETRETIPLNLVLNQTQIVNSIIMNRIVWVWV